LSLCSRWLNKNSEISAIRVKKKSVVNTIPPLKNNPHFFNVFILFAPALIFQRKMRGAAPFQCFYNARFPLSSLPALSNAEVSNLSNELNSRPLCFAP
jgi:hypothetical protein